MLGITDTAWEFDGVSVCQCHPRVHGLAASGGLVSIRDGHKALLEYDKTSLRATKALESVQHIRCVLCLNVFHDG